MVEASIAGIITIDSHGVAQTFSPATECLFGHESSEVASHNASVLVLERDQGKRDGHSNWYFSLGNAPAIGAGQEVTRLRKDGTLLQEHISVVELPIDWKKKLTGMVLDLKPKK